jgi:betaine-aldehyde dehydrogenase
VTTTAGADGHCWIGGRAVQGTSGQSWDVVDPATGRALRAVQLAGPAEVDASVAAARTALPAWSSAAPVDRSRALYTLAQLLEERAGELAATETAQTGKPIRLSTGFDVPGTVDNTVFFAGAARILEGRASGEYSADHTSAIRREAVGVVGSIVPWNYPLQMAAWKILPAVAAGNTIVLKPSELTPLTALMLAETALTPGSPTAWSTW